jgi:hypothetical protein
VTCDIARDFAAAHRVTDEGRRTQIERIDQLRQIVGEGVVVVALGRLA